MGLAAARGQLQHDPRFGGLQGGFRLLQKFLLIVAQFVQRWHLPNRFYVIAPLKSDAITGMAGRLSGRFQQAS